MSAGVFEKNIYITPDYCDMKSSMSPIGAFTIFQAIATEDADKSGYGVSQAAKNGKFWVTAHNRIDFLSSAWIGQELKAETWASPCDPEDKRCYKHYSLKKGDKTVALCKTQWAILSYKGEALPFKEAGFPEDYVYPENMEEIKDEPKWFEDDFSEEDLKEVYKVRSTDIDLGRHMNNIAYVKRLLDQFPAEKITGSSVKSIEIHYGSQCREGETLRIYCKEEGSLFRMCIRNSEGKAAVLALIEFI